MADGNAISFASVLLENITKDIRDDKILQFTPTVVNIFHSKLGEKQNEIAHPLTQRLADMSVM